MCLPGTLQIWTCCFLSYPKYTCMVFLSISMASWDIPLADTIGLGTDSHRTGKNQAKMRRLLVNNFRDLRFNNFGTCDSHLASVQQQDRRTSLPHHYICFLCASELFALFSIHILYPLLTRV